MLLVFLPLPILALLGSLAAAQQPPQADVRVDVNLVNVSFTVRDQKGMLRSDLKREDVTVLEDGVVQKVQLFARESDTPLTLGIVLDFSGSQAGLFDKNKETAVRFVRSVLRPEDRAFVVAFSRRIKLVCDLTPPGEKLEAALRAARTLRDAPDLGPPRRRGGASPVRDTLYHAAAEKLKNVAGRKALIILSDGQDIGSRTSLADTIEMLQSADTMLYALNTGTGTRGKVLRVLSPALLLIRSNLDRIADETGGREFKMRDVQVQEAFRQIAEELRATYAIGYVSSNPAQDGTFRKIEIRAAQPELKVRARRGYCARGAQEQLVYTGLRGSRFMTVGAFEAKTHLSALLDRVAKGERITITRNGVPAAILVPVNEARPPLSHQEIVDGMRALRKRVKPGKLSVREMIAEGRRF